MKLIVGLGNPGDSYQLTRHNLGFLALDALADRLDLLWPVSSSKFQAQVSEHVVGEDKYLLAKPQTYMNLSGEAVGALVRFYKILPQNVWVLHDELDIPFGEVRIKQGGGDAGHNGLGSITRAIGPNYWRFRLGIAGATLRDPIDPVDYVLQAFTAEEQSVLSRIIDPLSEQLALLVDSGETPVAGTQRFIQ